MKILKALGILCHQALCYRRNGRDWPDNHVWSACRERDNCLHRCYDNGFCDPGYTFIDGVYVGGNLCQTICLRGENTEMHFNPCLF